MATLRSSRLSSDTPGVTLRGRGLPNDVSARGRRRASGVTGRRMLRGGSVAVECAVGFLLARDDRVEHLGRLCPEFGLGAELTLSQNQLPKRTSHVALCRLDM